MSQHCLYRFYGPSGSLLYIGITFNPGSRWRQHRDTKQWWRDVAQITIESHPTRASVLLAEREAIKTEKPQYNILHQIKQKGWGTFAEDMPDCCHDHCGVLIGYYFPYRWEKGKGYYQCKDGCTWNCWWGHSQSGSAPQERGMLHG